MITLHIYLQVKPERDIDLEELYRSKYVPAISIQEGFRSTTLLKAFSKEMSAAIQATGDWNHEIDIVFDTEENRQKWAAGPEHSAVWPQIEAICDRVRWQGFDVGA